MSGAADAEDTATAQEVLRQAQAVISAQNNVSKILDAKLTSLLQASLNLAVASLGAATLAFAAISWLPAWGGLGLATMGACFALAAILSVWGLRGSNLGAPAIVPAALFERGVHRLPARLAYLAIAFDLQKVVTYNELASQRAARRMQRALHTALGAPALGASVAATAAATTPQQAVLAWAVMVGAIVAFLATARLFGAR